MFLLGLPRLELDWFFFVLKSLYCFKMAECLSFSDIVEGKSTQLSLKVAAGKSIDSQGQ